MSDGGKGSSPRPFSVSQETYANNFDNIFRKTPKDVDDQKAEDEAFNSIPNAKEFDESDRPNIISDNH